jgi:fatty acid desaturase
VLPGTGVKKENRMSSSSLPDREQYDPTFVHSRREAVVIFCSWVVALIWAVPYCYLNGYNVADPENIKTVFGIPAWLFWGIAAPWIAANLFTTWFCFAYMKDDDLGENPDEPIEADDSQEEADKQESDQ